ncbi:hypothetical protein ACWDOP_07530 [Nocardia sp. NPDC003693]
MEKAAPAPRGAILEALAPALGRGEAKRVIENRRGDWFLRSTAYQVEARESGDALLMLRVDLHGAATLPWHLNDRTRSDWLHPTPENLSRLGELVDQQQVLYGRKANLARAKNADRALATTAPQTEKDAAAAAVRDAEFKHTSAKSDLALKERALGFRRPLPAVRAIEEDGVALTALISEPVPAAIAAALQQYTVDKLRKRGNRRTYDLVESLVNEGQRDSTVVVLQQVPAIGQDGTVTSPWRGFHVTGNNRADARLQIYGVEAAQLLMGIPQSSLRLPGEEENRRLLLVGLREILRRISIQLNTASTDSNHEQADQAERAQRIAQVPARVVVGARTPRKLEVALRQLNVHDHLRGQLGYDDEDRALGLWSTVVKAYQADGLLCDLLAEAVTNGRIAPNSLNESVIADALVGAQPLDVLAILLSPGDPACPVTLRDVAIRCATVMLFPPVPPRPDGMPTRKHMPTGRYWPVVRTALQEAPWSQANGPKADRRTEIWAAVVAQHFVNRGNLLAAKGAFSARDVQFGVQIDARSLASILAACHQGNVAAWETLVRRHLLPGLINAPEPFVTSGQGSEAGADRKGVRRAPSNAIQALVNAYSDPPTGVTRQLLLSFAEAVLDAPDAADGVAGKAPGTFWALDGSGRPRESVLADKHWFDTLFPKTAVPRANRHSAEDGTAAQAEADTVQVDEDLPEDALTRMTLLRSELTFKLRASTDAVETAAEHIDQLLKHTQEAVRAREEAGVEEEPAEVQKLYMKDVREIKRRCADVTAQLDAVIVEMTGL